MTAVRSHVHASGINTAAFQGSGLDFFDKLLTSPLHLSTVTLSSFFYLQPAGFAGERFARSVDLGGIFRGKIICPNSKIPRF